MNEPTKFGRRGETGKPHSNGSAGGWSNAVLITVVSIAVFTILSVIGWVGALPDKPESDTAVGTAAVGRMWVTVDRAPRRTCPSDTCGVVGQFFFREAATVAETKNGWARTTDRYDAACEGGYSAYVDSGDAGCTADNGITDGKFAEWVRLELLSSERPPDPAEGATGLAAVVGQSDDFRTFQGAFVRAAKKLIADGKCTEAELREQGGFAKSSNRKGPVYFLYCGGMTASNRLYLNAETGQIFR